MCRSFSYAFPGRTERQNQYGIYGAMGMLRHEEALQAAEEVLEGETGS